MVMEVPIHLRSICSCTGDPPAAMRALDRMIRQLAALGDMCNQYFFLRLSYRRKHSDLIEYQNICEYQYCGGTCWSPISRLIWVEHKCEQV
jgi:hypothetical protein